MKTGGSDQTRRTHYLRQGQAALQAGDLPAARQIVARLLQLAGSDQATLELAGLVDYQSGAYDSACESLRQAASLGQPSPRLLVNYGEALRAAGRLEDADRTLRAGLSRTGAHRGLTVGLAAVALARNRPGETVALLSGLGPTGKLPPPALANLAMAETKLGRHQEALAHYMAGLAGGAAPEAVWLAFLASVRAAGPQQLTPEIARAVASRLDKPGFDNQELALILVHAIRSSPSFAALPDPDAFCNDPVVMALLPAALIADPELERALTALRRQALLGDLAQQHPGFCAALSQQCFLTDYAYAVTTEEAARLAALGTGDTDLLLRSLYEPLPPDAEATALPAPVVRQQIAGPAREAALARTVPRLTAMVGAASEAVRSQYERYPYPRWSSAPRRLDQTLAERLRRDDVTAPADLPQRPLKVLVAGCGTGRHALQLALGLAEADVTAVDLSLTSLGYAARRAEELGVSNVRFAQADIAGLGEHERRYDLIESVGVLHHMADPEAAWRVLAGLLKPGGLMRIGLYSRAARHAVEAARAHVRSLSRQDGRPDVRMARQAILGLPAGHPARTVVETIDFYSLSGCHDMLFNVQEREYDLEEIGAMLARLELDFLGFSGLPATGRDRYRALFPEDPACCDLSRWNRVEQEHPDLFIQMYILWCRPVGAGP